MSNQTAAILHNPDRLIAASTGVTYLLAPDIRHALHDFFVYMCLCSVALTIMNIVWLLVTFGHSFRESTHIAPTLPLNPAKTDNLYSPPPLRGRQGPRSPAFPLLRAAIDVHDPHDDRRLHGRPQLPPQLGDKG